MVECIDLFRSVVPENRYYGGLSEFVFVNPNLYKAPSCSLLQSLCLDRLVTAVGFHSQCLGETTLRF